MTMPWLADVLRAEGLTVVEHAGWKTRVIPGSWSPKYGVVHATAAPRSQSDARQVEIVRDGRSDLDGPIAVACVDRDARWHVLGAGRCNTTLVGTAGPYKGLGNSGAVGVEACNDNAGEPWPRAQYESYYRGWAAIARRLGWTAHNLVGHKEHTPNRKTDPTFNMDQFRANVARVLAGEDDDMLQGEDKEFIQTAVHGTQIFRTGATIGDVLRDLRGVPAALAKVEANLQAMAGRDWVDEQAIIDGVLAGLSGQDLDDVVTALRAAFGDDRASELGRLLTGGS